MIEFIKSFAVSDGRVFANIKQAQQEEILLVIFKDSAQDATDVQRSIAEQLVVHAEQIVDILSTTPTSKLKARALHGGRKPRKPKGGEPTTTCA